MCVVVTFPAASALGPSGSRGLTHCHRETVSALQRGEAGRQSGQLRRQPCELLEMGRREPCERPPALLRQGQTHDAVILRLAATGDQAGRFGAVDQADGAVVLEEEVVGDVADCRTSFVAVPPDRKEKLVLGRSEPGTRACCSLQRSKWRSPVRNVSRREYEASSSGTHAILSSRD